METTKEMHERAKWALDMICFLQENINREIKSGEYKVVLDLDVLRTKYEPDYASPIKKPKADRAMESRQKSRAFLRQLRKDLKGEGNG